MRTLKVFDLNMEEMVERFYVMMATVIVFIMLDQHIMAALLGNILAVSFILGVSFRKPVRKVEARVHRIEGEKVEKEAA
jgi:hypothetical protein